MPQDMNILCCYSCKMYQVHIVKKARKWQCKLCNAKQSVQKIYFQGSGKDCRLRVQHMNYSKANETSFLLHLEQENSSDGCNTTSAAQESDIEEPVESMWTKYLDSPKQENPSKVKDSSSDNIHEIEDMTNEKSPCNIVNNDSRNFEDIIDDKNFRSENIVGETEELCSTSFNYNHKIKDDCNFQDSGKLNKSHNDVANIFESYGELDDPIDI